MTVRELRFPSSPEDLSDAFNHAIALGIMQRERRDIATWWGRFELIASEYEDGVLVADEFYNTLSTQFVRVPRTEVAE